MPNSSGDLVTVWLRDEEELVRLTRHPDPDVRRWAADRWMALYPDHAHDRLAPLITDLDDEIRRDVALFLARSGDDKWRSVFRKGLELTLFHLFLLLHHLAHALALACLHSLAQVVDLIRLHGAQPLPLEHGLEVLFHLLSLPVLYLIFLYFIDV